MKPTIQIELTQDEVYEAIAAKAREMAGQSILGESHVTIRCRQDSEADPSTFTFTGAIVAFERTKLPHLKFVTGIFEMVSIALDKMVERIEGQEKD